MEEGKAEQKRTEEGQKQRKMLQEGIESFGNRDGVFLFKVDMIFLSFSLKVIAFFSGERCI